MELKVAKYKNKIYFVLFLFNFVIAHLFPFCLFLINLLALMILHLKKNNQIRNYIGFFLFVCWPCCFYVYLHCFAHAVMSDSNLLLHTYESLYFINMTFESCGFWILRLAAISTIQCPILGFQVNSIYFKQFLLETFYGLALISNITGLSFGFTIW
jgi:hypothetical protein